MTDKINDGGSGAPGNSKVQERLVRRIDGGPAFPQYKVDPWGNHSEEGGMSLRDWFAGQALANAAICTGLAKDYELRDWFGGRGGITRAEIIAKQAGIYADAMIAERGKKT